MPGSIARAICPYDYPDACGLLVEADNGRAVKITGDPDHPETRAQLCPKILTDGGRGNTLYDAAVEVKKASMKDEL